MSPPPAPQIAEIAQAQYVQTAEVLRVGHFGVRRINESLHIRLSVLFRISVPDLCGAQTRRVTPSHLILVLLSLALVLVALAVAALQAIVLRSLHYHLCF